MAQRDFFPKGAGIAIGELAALCGADVRDGSDADHLLRGVAPLDEAQADDLSFFDNGRYLAALAATKAGCVIVAQRNLSQVPQSVSAIVARDPGAAFALAGAALFPEALRPRSLSAAHGIAANASVDPSAALEDDVTIEPYAVIGPGAAIGRGTIVGAGAVIGTGCQIGRDCRIGANTTLQHALLGNRVILHPGVRIGQDGFGYVPGRAELLKVVQVGRVIIQDDVEIGANSAVDRGGIRDTVIGEGTKIDNLVQIAHNVRVGRHCVLVAQVALAGSVTLGDGVMIGGQGVVNNHVVVGDGAQIAAVSGVANDIPAGARWGGAPAKPIRDWLREVSWVTEMVKAGRAARDKDG